MVLPLVDEAKPKCYMCHGMFDDLKALRKHQEAADCGSTELAGVLRSREPAPGDVTVF